MQLTPGTLLQNGKYKIIKVLGQGGFGITYLGEQVVLGRKVAIKEFFMRDFCDRDEHTAHVTLGTKSSRAMVERFRQKFVKEAQTIAQLAHPHIIAIHDIFEENNTAYYVMEYLAHGSLDSAIPTGGMAEQEAIGYIKQICKALQCVHDNNVLHLDVKPTNILFRSKEEVVLIDFGISKHYDEDKGNQTSSTPAGISEGYAPTEQYESEGISTFSASTDIYALGATLYKTLTGERPPKAGVVLNNGLPALPAHISAATRNTVKQAMQPRRDDRPQSIADFLALLDGKAAAADYEGTKPVGDLGGGGGNNRGGSTAGGGTQPGQKAPGGNGGSGSTTLPGGNKPAPRHSKKNLWIALAVVVGLICGVAGYTLLSGRGSAPAPAAQEEGVSDTLATDSIDVAEVAALIHNVTSPEEGATNQTEELSRLQAENDRMREQLRQDSIANAQREAAAAAEAARQAQAEAERQAEARRQAATRGNITETVNGVTFKMVYVQGGTFSMGAQKTNSSGTNYDSDAWDRESPVHSVTLGDYYIAETEVTQALWQAVMGNNPSYFKGENRPVENVSWDDAVSFCKELSRLTGRTYVLPTEAQWEYAARGGKNSTDSKYSGSHSISNVAWYDGNSDSKTHEVKGKLPNALGIYDMSGNVWEWCSDYWTDNYNASPNTSWRVLRGGGWYSNAQFCRVSYRIYDSPSYRYGNRGFRVALSVNR